MSTGALRRLSARGLLFAASALPALAPAGATTGDETPADLASVTTSLEQEIGRVLEETGIPSISLALIRDGEVVWTNAQGYANVGARVPATVDTYYCAGSTFKFVTATAVMQLVEQGELTLDTTLNELVGDDLAVEGADDVTVRHLLSHHSALDAYRFARRLNGEGSTSFVPLWSRRRSITPEEILSHTRRTGPPGVEFEYSNDGYAILGYLVEELSIQRYDDYVAEHVLRPLGVDTDAPSVPSPRVVEHLALPYEFSVSGPVPRAQVRGDAFAAGDVYLKASDMARFVAAQLNGGEYQGGRILTAASTEEMRRPQFEGRPYGLGVRTASLLGHDIIHHGGSIPGYCSFMVAEPSTRQGVYVMANARSPAIGELARHAMGLLWGGRSNEVTLSHDLLDEYVGEYAFTPTSSVTVSREEDRVFVQLTGKPRLEVFASSETDFFLRQGSATITFGRDEEGGPVTHLTLHKVAGDQRADRNE